jgi:uncharacterized protein involved in response to NO
MTESNQSNSPTWVPFAYGFRPFFLLAGLYAVVSIAAWIWVWRTGSWPLQQLPPQYWHGHEMIFGFIAAAMAGFLLTAVPSWTGSRGFEGTQLIVLTVLWVAGRIAFSLGETLPVMVLSAIELAFIPMLGAMLAPALLRSGNRNWPMLVLLALFWAADSAFLHGMGAGDPLISRSAMLAAMNIVLILITIIGGRIVPAFTRNALRARGIEVSPHSPPVIERLVMLSMLAMLLCDLFLPGSAITAATVAFAAMLHLWRLASWHGWQTRGQPIVWVLHLAYLWLPVGLGLKAAWLAGGFGWAAHWLHALGAGAAGLMILAVMTRAALGHTGRPLQVRGSIAVAYGLLALSVIVRVLGPLIVPLDYPAIVVAAAIPWIAAFLLFLAVYTPILLRPRVDGKRG